jgi:hypothetical protein
VNRGAGSKRGKLATVAGGALTAGALAAGALAAGALGASSLAATACGSSDAGVLDACADPATTCFSNGDCADPTTRCTVPSTADPTLDITCCLPGPRGALEAGAPCTALDDCLTAICAYTPSGTYCSGPCTADGQCPMELPSCVSIDAGSFCGLPP